MIEVADEWMRLQEVDLHDGGVILEEPAHFAQAPQAVVDGAFAGMFELIHGMLAGESEQTLEDAHALGPALAEQAVGPRAGVGSEQATAFEEIVGPALDDYALAGVDVSLVGGEASGFGADVDRDLFEALVEQADQPGLGAEPDVVTDILRRHRVI